MRRRLDADPAFGRWLAGVAADPVTRRTVLAWYRALGGGPDLSPAALGPILRQLRARVFYTLLVRDIERDAPLHEIVSAMSTMADLVISHAYRSVARELAQRHGVPRDPASGLPQEMIIVAMGKLGGRELNVSSDVDLIMLYGEEGQTDGLRPISHHEFYHRVTQRMLPLLSRADVHGPLLRVDLRLRPDGDAGPLTWSLDALEHYLITQGRDWERYAWVKARPLALQAFDDSAPQAQLDHLEGLRRPFVYRKYFDIDALVSLRSLSERIHGEWRRRAAASSRLDAEHHIKLGTGGIREAEFVVQLNQLVRGGRLPTLQQRSLLSALHRQRRAGVMPAEVAQPLEAAYAFLRRVEHRLQYREDEQTHLLPTDPDLRESLAAAMNLPHAAFEAELRHHRGVVHQAFRDAFRLAGMGDNVTTAPTPSGPDMQSQPSAWLASHLSEPDPDVERRLHALLDSTRVRQLSHERRRRLDALLPALMHAAADTPTPAVTAVRLLDFVGHIVQRSAYLALMAEYPDTLKRVARLVGASAWAADYLCRHPLLLDGLIEWQTLMRPPDLELIGRQLSDELDASVLPDGQPDVEHQMNLMRDTQHQVTFQLLAQDLAGRLTVEALADELSALADLMLEQTLKRVWPLLQRTPASHLPTPPFAIIAYGKLGGKELGYASDLDLVFLYDDPDPDAGARYARLGQRILSWLTTLTSSGRLYDVDLRLRPDGDAGLLAAPIDAFSDYQRQHAWSWEHQALTRARHVAGDTAIGARFEALRRDILLLPRDPTALARDIREMRDRIRRSHPNDTSEFDLKHDPGGMVDVEFVTQFLVLAHARWHPALLDNLGNIALLRLAAEAGLVLPSLAQAGADAYRVFRRHQHALRLQGAQRARVPPSELQAERDAVLALWQHVLAER